MNEVNALIWPSPSGLGVMDPGGWQQTVGILIGSAAIPAVPSDDAYRTDLMRGALDSLTDLDTTGDSFVKGTVEITPAGS